MKILLIYYTGTYNTRFVTEKLKDRMKKNGHHVDCVEINCDTLPVDTNAYDLIGFGYPIYGFNSPLPFNRYLKKLNFSVGQKYFIYKNSGETFALNNSSSRIILRRMKRCKAVFVGEYHFVMPYNIHFSFEREFVREILEKNEKLIEILIYELENGLISKIPSNLIYNLTSSIISIQKVGGNVNSFFYRVETDKCINCNICVMHCPEKNIKVNDGKIKFGHHCDMCMRCSFFCPTNAIKIGFLESWKVNGDYNLKKIALEPLPAAPYITSESKGFYKCFIKHFADIDKKHENYFNDK